MFPLGLLRLFSILDGLSFVILLYFSIYEKRILGNEDAIRTPGMIHGVIFCVFVIFLLFSILYHRPPEDQVLGFKLQVGDLADQGSSGPAEDPYCVNGWVRSDEKDKMVKL